MTPFHRKNLGAGYLDRGDAVEIPPGYLSSMFNFYPDQNSFYTRKGYTDWYASITKPWGATAIQAFHFWEDNSGNFYIIVITNGQIYRDPMTGAVPTNITGSITLSTDQDTRFDMFTWNGNVYGTDSINPPFYIAPNSNAVLLSNLNRNVPSRASTGNAYRNHIWWGNFTDFDAANTNKPWGTIHSEIGDPGLYNGEEGVRNVYNKSQRVVKLVTYNNTQYILMNRSIHIAKFSPSTALGQARTNFVYDQLDHQAGLSAAGAVVETPRGLFILCERGVYWAQPGSDTAPFQYVGKPTENFWKDINKARLPYAVGAEIREKNLVIFCVPYGSGQSTNNAAIVFNYDSWFQFGQEAESFHPAFAIWDGVIAQPFAFNALLHFVDTDGRHRTIGGDYSGNVFLLDDGSDDNGVDFSPRFGFPLIGDPRSEFGWQSFILDCYLPQRHLLQVTQTNYEFPISYYRSLDAGTVGAALDTFVLDQDVLAGGALGPIRGTLFGESRYTKLDFELLAGADMGVHALTVYGEAQESWV